MGCGYYSTARIPAWQIINGFFELIVYEMPFYCYISNIEVYLQSGVTIPIENNIPGGMGQPKRNESL
jgi:hypothetical protein